MDIQYCEKEGRYGNIIEVDIQHVHTLTHTQTCTNVFASAESSFIINLNARQERLDVPHCKENPKMTVAPIVEAGQSISAA